MTISATSSADIAPGNRKGASAASASAGVWVSSSHQKYRCAFGATCETANSSSSAP